MMDKGRFFTRLFSGRKSTGIGYDEQFCNYVM